MIKNYDQFLAGTKNFRELYIAGVAGIQIIRLCPNILPARSCLNTVHFVPNSIGKKLTYQVIPIALKPCYNKFKSYL